jgi:formylglycine-generating enzyme required for sulfatase activity
MKSNILILIILALTFFTKMNAIGQEKNANLAPDLVLVQGGSFNMGSVENDDEKPKHVVNVSSFYLGKYEVTVGEFRKFMSTNSYTTDAEREGISYCLKDTIWVEMKGVNWTCDAAGNKRPRNEDNHPVLHVSHNDAVAYCIWLSKQTGKTFRLPTEAEWEYAAFGGIKHDVGKYACGDDLGSVGWYINNSGNTTHAVGGKQANSLGIFDMSGNVWEWCSDWYDGKYYSSSPTFNPTGPETGVSRVLRGGSWGDEAILCRSANRIYNTPSIRYGDYGFRVVSQK